MLQYSGPASLTVDLGQTTDLGYDVLAFHAGSLSITSNATLAVSAPYGVVPGGVYPILTFDGGATYAGQFSGLPEGRQVALLGNGVSVYIHYTPSAITLNAIPEPSSFAIAVPTVALLRRRRR